MLLKKLYTLVFVRNENKILLGYKKRGFGVNKWNGFGGKVELKETIIEAAVRELKEECCLEVNAKDLKHIGLLEFTFEGNNTMMDVRVFSTRLYQGSPSETEEMSPKWFGFDEIPYNDMWPDDIIWLPHMIKEKMFYGRFHYQGYDKILNYHFEELESMENLYTKIK